jgi:CubicO group peptidase (beta-lactamase class C family)
MNAARRENGWITILLLGCATMVAAAPVRPFDAAIPPTTTNVYPGKVWPVRSPEQAGASSNRLVAFGRFVGGRGCVTRNGIMIFEWGEPARSSDVASAFKPLLSSLMLIAIQERRIGSVDEPVARFEPRLKELNHGKDAGITWRHLASQTSGYGWSEQPGAAYAYNDFALALYYDTLTEKVFGTNGTEVLRTRLAGALQFEDPFTFNAFGPGNRPGRLAVSCRDFARFGLLILRGGQWRGRQLLDPVLLRMALTSPIAPETPLTQGAKAAMLPGQRSIGGSGNITPVGPGYYSFNWWLNATNRTENRLFVNAPPDTIVASGHGGKRALVIVPSLDLVACWNDSTIDDQDNAPGNAAAKINIALRMLVSAFDPR